MFYFTINQAHAEHSNREKCQEKGLDVYFAFFFSSHKNRTNSNAYESLCYCHMTSSWSDVQIH